MKELVDEIRRAEKLIERYAGCYHSHESDCPAGFKDVEKFCGYLQKKLIGNLAQSLCEELWNFCIHEYRHKDDIFVDYRDLLNIAPGLKEYS